MILLCFSGSKSIFLHFQDEDEGETSDVEGEDSDAETKDKDGDEELHVGFLSSDVAPCHRYIFV